MYSKNIKKIVRKIELDLKSINKFHNFTEYNGEAVKDASFPPILLITLERRKLTLTNCMSTEREFLKESDSC